MRQRSRSGAIPEELNSSCSKLVYLYLQSHGGATVDELKADLDMQLLTLYGVLRRLREADLVTKTDDRWTLNEATVASRAIAG